jgi:hypothetical protein
LRTIALEYKTLDKVPNFSNSECIYCRLLLIALLHGAESPSGDANAPSASQETPALYETQGLAIVFTGRATGPYPKSD